MDINFQRLLDSSERNRKKKKFFPEFWLVRGYKNERAYDLAERHFLNTITEKEINEISIRTRFNLKFWTIRGYSEEDAICKVKEIQSKNSLKRYKKYSKKEILAQSTASLEYYLARGASAEEAIILRRKRQSTFSMQKCISKYGEENGLEIFNTRQAKWQKTLSEKSPDQMTKINKSKGITLENYIKKYGEIEGAERYQRWVIEYVNRVKRNGHARFSVESLKWFSSFIPNEILRDAEFGEKEFWLFDRNRLFFYDFRYRNIIIEYHGSLYHFNPEIEKPDWINPFGVTPLESLQRDLKKKKLAEQNGFVLFEYFSNSTKETELTIKKQIIEALTK